MRAFCVGALAAVTLAGVAHADYVDCRTCHNATAFPLRDFAAYYQRDASHHMREVAYPSELDTDFVQPDSRVGEIWFFDTNRNGVVDASEVQLFGLNKWLDCSSCHREHGQPNGSPPAPSVYLRATARPSTLCSTCHRK